MPARSLGTHFKAAFNKLLEASAGNTSCAWIMAASMKESWAWVHAFLMSSLGLRINDSVVHVATGLRWGVTLCRPHLCQKCGVELDYLGTHGLSCRKSQGLSQDMLQ